MHLYRVVIRGENFAIQFNDEPRPRTLRFLTMRWVDAEDDDAAELAAVDMIRRDSTLRPLVINDPADPPRLFAHEIVPDRPENMPPSRGIGYIWFDPDEGDPDPARSRSTPPTRTP